MEIVNLIELTRDIQDQHKNFVVSNINSHCLRIAVFTGEMIGTIILIRMNYLLY
ncbi:hypothetical protein AS54_4670 [Bacillus cereus 03BB102]|uniref:Uncharacterized protein n=1 Tax=Bacillus cereus (strain 03BB102) TaxID=572264 RepID=A0A158RIW2_BACC3|nr:conserved hypothetical protein [Bacillus cereus 03BB102]AEW57752.1 Hypothetical protein bcf_23165 [Bacillus cereus F837/76]AJG56271.1 hypothetical protein AS54_4670 [Bacillus cereus 03BB102]